MSSPTFGQPRDILSRTVSAPDSRLLRVGVRHLSGHRTTSVTTLTNPHLQQSKPLPPSHRIQLNRNVPNFDHVNTSTTRCCTERGQVQHPPHVGNTNSSLILHTHHPRTPLQHR